jgi:hypothetical protein
MRDAISFGEGRKEEEAPFPHGTGNTGRGGCTGKII